MKSAEEFIKEHGKLQFEKPENKKIENSKQQKIQVSNELLEFDQLKTKVLKYVLYKKRTEQEVRKKFSSSQNANFIEHEEELEEYELNCAKKVIVKKQIQLEREEIERFLYKKGYPSSCIRKAYEEIE